MPTDALREPVYLAGNHALSILDLLHRFTEAQYQLHGVSRLSDLHLKVGEPARYRFDSELIPLPEAAPISEGVLRKLILPLLSEEKRAILEGPTPCDVDAAFDWPEERLSFRINIFRDREGLSCAIRALPRSVPPLEKIGFPREKVYRALEDLKQGLVVVTGVTGSGKSTTIASLLHRINSRRRVRLITLEDPIEYVLESELALISQRELGSHVASFADGLRSALREDPDIIFVGEMRDPETAALALTAAETGHLVLSTMHTRDTRGAITRIVDMFPPERSKELATQLSFSLSYVLGQKLVPREGGGRRVAMEVLRNISAIGNLIRTGNWHQIYSVIETRRKEGLNTLEHHLLELVQRGEIRAESAIRYANDPQAMDELISRNKSSASEKR